MSGDGWLAPGTCGVQLAMFDRLSSGMTRVADELDAAGRQLFAILTAAEVDTGPAMDVKGVARWVNGVAPELRRRAGLAHDLDAQRLSLPICTADGSFLRMPDRLGDQTAQASGYQAADLLRRATEGDRGALYSLLDYQQHAANPHFVKALLERLGPTALLDIPYGLTRELRVDVNDRSKMLTANAADTRAALALLAHALAKGTDPASPAYVGDAYLKALADNGRAGFPSGQTHPHHVGYQALATILAADPKTRYSDTFLRTVGSDMIAYTRHNPAPWRPIPDTAAIRELGTLLDDPAHPDPSPTDILQPLLIAAANTRTGAQALLGTPPGEPTSNLTYLLHDRTKIWGTTDQATALGRTISAAASGADPESRRLFDEFTAVRGADLLTHVKYADGHKLQAERDDLDPLSGLRPTTTDLLLAHLPEVISRVDAAPASSDAAYERLRHYFALTADASLDEPSFARLVAAHLTLLDEAARTYARTGNEAPLLIYAQSAGHLLALRTEISAAIAHSTSQSNEQLKSRIDSTLDLFSPSAWLESTFHLPPEVASLATAGLTEKAKSLTYNLLADHSQSTNTEQSRTTQQTTLTRQIDKVVISAYAISIGRDGDSTLPESISRMGSSAGWDDDQFKHFLNWSTEFDEGFSGVRGLVRDRISSGYSGTVDSLARIEADGE
ncbi:hypothetical protein GCM10027589_27070 [Actinocorallia lasiicapitis]